MTTFQIKSLNNRILNLNKIGIIYNTEHEKASKLVEKLEKVLKHYGYNSVIREIMPGKGKHIEFFDKSVTFAVVIGGDGTVLGAARFYAPLKVPILGINIGRLGFLSQLKPDELGDAIKRLAEGKFKIEDRLMLSASDNFDNPTFNHTALNDIVIKGGSISRTTKLLLYINGNHVCDYLADGIIISSPTGSTAYTLSAGGPVVVPELEAIVIAPICPHALTSRPIIIPANERISVEVCNSELVYLTADGQENVQLKNNDIIHIKQSEFKAQLILLEKGSNGFYNILREKLHWGVSPGSTLDSSS